MASKKRKDETPANSLWEDLRKDIRFKRKEAETISRGIINLMLRGRPLEPWMIDAIFREQSRAVNDNKKG